MRLEQIGFIKYIKCFLLDYKITSQKSSILLKSIENSASHELTSCQGSFVPALKKLLAQVHHNISAKDESLEYVESLILKLLAMLSSKPPPQSVTVSQL